MSNIEKRKVLISGGSIAGPAVAWWLNKYGFETVLVERWPEFRKGGQNIDVRGAGRDIVIKMGLFDKIKAKNTTEAGMRLIDTKGTTKASFPAGENGITAELEILRGDLAEVIYDATRNETRYIFGDFIVGIDEDDEKNKAVVRFNSGKIESFDIVILADGVRSRTRKLVFGDEPVLHRVGLSIAYTTIPRAETDTDWAKGWIPGERRTISMRPDPYNTTRACLTFMSQKGFDGLDQHDKIDLLRRRFRNAGYEIDRILDSLETTDDLYCEDLVQVKAPHYSRGRVVMIGDAAYCATPISGAGTTLSLTGAYLLAGELSKSPSNYAAAFECYENLMKPIVEKSQKLTGGAPGIAHPATWWGVAILYAVARTASFIVSLPWPAFVTNWISSLSSDGIKLPEYKV